MDQKLDFSVGDQAVLMDRQQGQERQVNVTILEAREILGKITFVIETQDGKRKVVGASQLRKTE